MSKKLILILFAFWAIQGNAQLLWKISGNGLDKPSYLFGTHHAASDAICDSIAGFQEAFDSCSQLYGEIVFDEMQAMAQQVMAYIMLPQDSLLDVLLTAEDYKLLDDILKKQMGMGAEQVKGMKPAALSAQLTLPIAMQVFKNNGLPLDMIMQSQAKAKGMPVKGLEDVLFQTQLLFAAPLTEQVTGLSETLRNFDKAKQFNIEMCEAFMKQDLAGLYRSIKDQEFGFRSGQVEKLVYNRNRNWAGQLKAILPQQPVFIVVGAGHLPGEQGLIALLRKQGFTVSPVW